MPLYILWKNEWQLIISPCLIERGVSPTIEGQPLPIFPAGLQLRHPARNERDVHARELSQTVCRLLFHGDCARECHAQLQRRTRRSRGRHHPRRGGPPPSHGGHISPLPQRILLSASLRGRLPNGRASGLERRGFSEGRSRARDRALGKSARRASLLAL